MKYICAPRKFDFDSYEGRVVVLYGQPNHAGQGSGGAKIANAIRRRRLRPTLRAWDLLSLAISVVAADIGAHRKSSPDGWTRDLHVQIAVKDTTFWQSQVTLVEQMLGFLTTDRWKIEFVDGGHIPQRPRTVFRPKEDSVLLLSGGLDSLIGAIDVAVDRSLLAVSHTVRGNADAQARFASDICGGLTHLQISHAVKVPESESPPGSRARSIAFFAYGVLAATSLARYRKGKSVDLFVCENGFISLNPPLTASRLGSLSTRTTHPYYLHMFQRLLDAAKLNVKIRTPYQFKTKGEMLAECLDQAYISQVASESTSCGRFNHFGYQHCGRCVPCIIRRSAFLRAGYDDHTVYRYSNLGANTDDCARFDDVRSAAMAVGAASRYGFDSWIGSSLSAVPAADLSPYRGVIQRGLSEIESFLTASGVS